MTDICQSCCRESSSVRDGLCRQCRISDVFGAAMASLSHRLDVMTDDQLDDIIERYRRMHRHVVEMSVSVESPRASSELTFMAGRLRFAWQMCIGQRIVRFCTLPTVAFDL